MRYYQDKKVGNKAVRIQEEEKDKNRVLVAVRFLMTSLSLSLSLSSILPIFHTPYLPYSLSSILPIFHTPYLTVSACIAVCLHRSLSLSLSVPTLCLGLPLPILSWFFYFFVALSPSDSQLLCIYVLRIIPSLTLPLTHSLSLSICTGSIADQHDVRHRPHHRKAKPQAELSTLRNIQ